MNHIKTLLVDGQEVTDVNARIEVHDLERDVPEGHVYYEFEKQFDDDFFMRIKVVWDGDSPSITSELYNEAAEMVGNARLIPGGLDQDYQHEYGSDLYRLTIQRLAKEELTDKAADDYVGSDGARCPHCGSTEIDSGRLSADGGEAWARVECAACGARWRDHFKLTSIEALEPPSTNLPGST